MEVVALQLVIAHQTGSLEALAYLAVASQAPILLLGIFGGVVADRVNRKKLMMATQGLLMVIAVSLAALSAIDRLSVNLILALSAAHGIILAFNMPAWQVLTPRLVPREELTKAITLNGVQFNLARVLGPATAGVLMGLYGPTPLFMINAATFVGVLVALAGTPDSPAPPRNGVPWWEQIREAMGFLFLRRGPLAVFIAMVLMAALAAPLIRMLPLFVIDVYGLQPGDADKGTGWLLAALGVGAVAGGLILRYVPPWYPKHHFIPLSLMGAGLVISLFSIITSLWGGLLVMVMVGTFWLWGFNQAWAAMQDLVPDAMRGRVMALSNVASFGAMALGTLASGYAGEQLKALLDAAAATQLAVGAPSALLMLAGLVMLIWRTPEIDGLPSGAPGYAPRRSLMAGIPASGHRPRR